MSNSKIELIVDGNDTKSEIEKVIALSRCNLLFYENIKESSDIEGIIGDYVGYESIDNYNDLKNWLQQYDWSIQSVLQAWHNDPIWCNSLHPKARSTICQQNIQREFFMVSEGDFRPKIKKVSTIVPNNFGTLTLE